MDGLFYSDIMMDFASWLKKARPDIDIHVYDELYDILNILGYIHITYKEITLKVIIDSSMRIYHHDNIIFESGLDSPLLYQEALAAILAEAVWSHT